MKVDAILRELVKGTLNKKTNQVSLHIKKTKLKELNMDVEDLLDIPILKKLKLKNDFSEIIK